METFLSLVNGEKKIENNLKKTNYWRWFGFILAVIGAYILGNAQVLSQWIGWTICSISCLIWIFMGIKDRDVPRTLMEVMYFIIGIRAIINWINFN
jgi:drug/metabolite transporter (DMT)-like permease